MRIYTQANLISLFIGNGMAGEKIPSFEELFPWLITEEDKAQKEKANLNLLRDTMMAFMELHNAQRKK